MKKSVFTPLGMTTTAKGSACWEACFSPSELATIVKLCFKMNLRTGVKK